MNIVFKQLRRLGVAAMAMAIATPAFAVSFSFTGVEDRSAATNLNGSLDVGTDFSSQTNAADDEATATNGGPFSANSFTAVGDGSVGAANTLIEAEVELSGRGRVEIDIAYDLFVEGFGNDAGAEAFAFITASLGDQEVSELVQLSDAELMGAGTSLLLANIVTLSFAFDDFGLGPFTELLFIETSAFARSVGLGFALADARIQINEIRTVPAPGLLILLTIGLLSAIPPARRLLA